MTTLLIQVGWMNPRDRFKTHGTKKIYQTEGIANRYNLSGDSIPVYVKTKET